MRVPEFWALDNQSTVMQVNNVTRGYYEFLTVEDAKKAQLLMSDYVEKWARKRNREPLYPDTLIRLCEKKGIKVLGFH